MTDPMKRERFGALHRFKQYPAYKDSGVEWLGEIPAHWKSKRVRQSCSRVTDGAHISPDTSSADFPFVSTVDIRGGSIDFAGSLRTSAASYAYMERTGCRPKRGDVLFSKDGTVGTTAVVTTDREFAVASSLVILSPEQVEVDARWLDYWLNAIFIKDQVELLLSGAALRRISVGKVGGLPIIVPPELDEQRIIAGFLDRKTAKIDALVAKKERLIELLQEQRTALITRAVTEGLDPNVSMKDSGVEWLERIPAHWQVRKIKRLFRQAKRQGHPDLTVLSVYREFGVIEKSSRDDNFNRTPEDLDVYQLVNPGDLVINKMKAWQGSLGISSHSGITSPDYVVYSPRRVENGRFLHYFLRNSLLVGVYLSMSNGIRPSQWRLEPERFEDLWVFLPPAHEQQQIVTFVDRETSKIDRLVAKVRDAVERLKELRTALISDAVTGKIDVREEVA